MLVRLCIVIATTCNENKLCHAFCRNNNWEIGYWFWPFWSQIAYGFDTWVRFSDEPTFSSISIRPSAFHNTFDVWTREPINYKADLKQGIDLNVRSYGVGTHEFKWNFRKFKEGLKVKKVWITTRARIERSRLRTPGWWASLRIFNYKC